MKNIEKLSIRLRLNQRNFPTTGIIPESLAKEDETMFVVVMAFPPVKQGKDAEFREWFASSNQQFSTLKGFIRRRLLRPLEGGNYAAIVEFENQEAFKDMHCSPVHDTAGECVKPLLDGKPTPHFYDVVTG
jgi:heme-degrading monooxygenase HmoA